MAVKGLAAFEQFVRASGGLVYADGQQLNTSHPFESRNIHPYLPLNVRELFDDGHYSQATFEAFKFVDKEVSRLSGISESGEKLMMASFIEHNPSIAFTARISATEKDEQRGYKFLFAGSIVAIRNPRGHEYSLVESPDECLDHLALASALLRRVEIAGFHLTSPVQD